MLNLKKSAVLALGLSVLMTGIVLTGCEEHEDRPNHLQGDDRDYHRNDNDRDHQDSQNPDWSMPKTDNR